MPAAPRYKSQSRKEAGSINAEQQLEHLIEQYQNLIFSICYRSTGDYFEAQDLTQETFLSAYKNLASFDGRYERAWITKIAANKCVDYLKRASRRSIPTEDSYFAERADRVPAPEHILMEQEVRERLYRCCMQLKAPYRQVALDYFYHEMDIQELVNKTGKNIKTLQTQIYRAKAMLRKLYRREET